MTQNTFLLIALILLKWVNPAKAQILNSTNTELISNNIYTICADREGFVWVGTDNGGFYDGLVSIRYINETTIDSRRYTTQETGCCVLQTIYCIAVEDRVTNPSVGAPIKWIGTPNGLVSFNGAEWKQHAVLPDNFIHCIAFDNNANKWIGTNKGLVKYDGENVTVYNATNTKLPSDKIKSVLVDTKNNVWAGTDKGLAKFDGKEWTIFITENSPIPNNSIFSIAEDREKNIYIGTNDGVAKFDGTSVKKKNWTIFTTKNSDLPNNVPY